MAKKKENSNRKRGLTPNQKPYWDAVCKHISEFHSFPTRVDLANEVGVSVNAAQDMLKRLEKKGFIEKLSKGATRKSYRLSNCKVSITHLKPIKVLLDENTQS